MTAVGSAVIAFVALLFSIYQAKRSRHHNKLTLKPHLRIRFKANKDGNGKYIIDITNHGEGPAFIRSLKIFNKGQDITSNIFAQALSQIAIKQLFRKKDMSGTELGLLTKRDVIPKGETHTLLSVDIEGDRSVFLNDSRTFLKGLEVEVLYSSLHEEIFKDRHQAIVTLEQDEIIKGVITNLSYFLIREIIGWVGLLLPALLIAIAWLHNSSSQYFYQPSISHYYYTVSGFLFIGLITLIGVFLISYRGYEPEKGELSDNIITWIGGILILLVAIVPTPFEWIECYRPTPIAHNHAGWGWLHFGSAVGFFLAMSYLSIKKFTKGDEPFSTDKIKRNKVYKLCGWGMLVVLGIAGILIFGFDIDKKWDHLIFWVEVILLILFGTSWLVKGKGLARLGIQKDDYGGGGHG